MKIVQGTEIFKIYINTVKEIKVIMSMKQKWDASKKTIKRTAERERERERERLRAKNEIK